MVNVNMKQKLETEYLSQEHLDGFNNYKYNSIDSNPLSNYILHPFWNKVVLLCPLWLAPNLLTFLGFLLNLFTFLLLAYYDPELYASSTDNTQREYPDIPNYVFLISAFSTFTAHTLDGIDGKQARRTGTSGPLGELFDHSLDSWSAVLIPVSLYSVFGRSDHSISTLRFYFVLWNVFINLYMSHWEKYHTGVLVLSWGYDTSMVITTAIFLITGIFRYELWKFDLPYGLNAGNITELFFYFSGIVVNIPVIVCNTLRTCKTQSLRECLRPLAPVLLCMVFSTVWVLGSQTDIIERHPRTFYLMIGTLFANICTRLIVCAMSNTPCSVWNPLLLPLGAAAFGSCIFPPSALFNETIILHLTLAAVVSSHIHYGACVVRQMCRHFHINCFKI